MKILLSIKPEYAEKILSGQKRYEFRKVLPKRSDINVVIIYATKPIGKVIGEFYIDSFLTDLPSKLWLMTKRHSGISKAYFNKYFDGRKKAHAIVVGDVRRYETPMDLVNLLPNSPAPQSFCYVN